MTLKGLLFDLDGTLADTAPDLVAVLNQLLSEAGLPPMPFALARNAVSHGAIGLIRLGFGLAADDPVDAGLRQRFLDLYQRNGHNKSRLFIELKDINQLVSRHGLRWGVVTNKPDDLTRPLLAHLGLLEQAGSVVSGDTLPQKKPHPAPLTRAAAELGVAPADCVYLGDAARDIEAGVAAGMRTVATSYGYIRPGEDIAGWQADAIVDHPRRIQSMIDRLIRTN